MSTEPRHPCVRCGKRTTSDERCEAFIFDLPPCCEQCHEAVSSEIVKGVGLWPTTWRGGYYWSKQADCFLIHGDDTCKWWERGE